MHTTPFPGKFHERRQATQPTGQSQKEELLLVLLFQELYPDRLPTTRPSRGSIDQQLDQLVTGLCDQWSKNDQQLTNYPRVHKYVTTSPVFAVNQQTVHKLLTEQLPAEIYQYHNIGHTYRVTEQILTTAEHYQQYSDLTDEQVTSAAIAGLRHDTGYIDQYQKNEQQGAARAHQFLHSQQEDYPALNSQLIAEVVSAIRATQLSSTPITLSEKIVKESDFSSLSNRSFRLTNMLMRNEYEATAQRRDHELPPRKRQHFPTRWKHSKRLLKKVKQELTLDWQLDQRKEGIDTNIALLNFLITETTGD